jgi:hypothetical protein
MAAGIRRNDALAKGREAAKANGSSDDPNAQPVDNATGSSREPAPADGLFHPIFRGQKVIAKVYGAIPKDSPLRLFLSVMGGMKDISPVELAGKIQEASQKGNQGLAKSIAVQAWAFGFRAPEGMTGFGMPFVDDLLAMLDKAAAS